MREDGRAHRRGEVFPPLVETAREPKGALEKGDRSFDAGAEALSGLEGIAVLATSLRFAAPALAIATTSIVLLSRPIFSMLS